MAKKIKSIVKLQIIAGKASPNPPVGAILGQQGLNIGDFCNRFNEKTKAMNNDLIPVLITVYEDRTFDFTTKISPVSYLLKKAANIQKGSATSNKVKVGKITMDQAIEIAKLKMPDLNTKSIDSAVKMVLGTARNMGIEVKE